MTDQKSVVLSAAGKNVELPVHAGTLGAPCIDITRLPKETGLFTYDPGFVATASCRSAVTYIDGDEGVLLYRGYPIEQLAKHSNFLEVSYLQVLVYALIPSILYYVGILMAIEADARRHEVHGLDIETPSVGRLLARRQSAAVRIQTPGRQRQQQRDR